MRDRGGVPVAKRRTVVAFELDSRLVLASQKCQQSQEWRGSWSRNAELSSLLDLRCVFASQNEGSGGGSRSRNAELSSLLNWTRSSRLKSVNSLKNGGGPGRETPNYRRFWTCVASSRLKMRDRGGVPVAKRRTVVAFELDSRLVLASQNCQQSQEWRGSWSRNAELSSLLDLRCVFASQNEGSGGGSRSRNAELSSLLNWTRVWSSRLKSVNSLKNGGGPGRETPSYRRFWTCVASSRLKMRDRGGGPGRETQNCRRF